MESRIGCLFRCVDRGYNLSVFREIQYNTGGGALDILKVLEIVTANIFKECGEFQLKTKRKINQK